MNNEIVLGGSTEAETKLWDIAWEDGHSEGYYSVAQHADALADLLRD